MAAGAMLLIDGGRNTLTGGGMMTASLAVTVASVGTSSPVTVPTAAAGGVVTLAGIAEAAYGSMVGQRANHNLTNQNGRVYAHVKKKQSTGKSGGDKHDKQYTHGGKNRPVNPNQRKNAQKRKDKGKDVE